MPACPPQGTGPASPASAECRTASPGTSRLTTGLCRRHLQNIATVALATGVASVAGALFNGHLLRQSECRALVRAAALGAAACLAMLPLGGPRPVPVAAANVLWSLCIGVGQPALATLASELRPELRGAPLALNGSTQEA